VEDMANSFLMNMNDQVRAFLSFFFPRIGIRITR
jgi:hypothetical protein